MLLKNVGDDCVIDFSEISENLFGEATRYAKNPTVNDRRNIERVVAELFEDYMSKSMTWTKRFNDFNENYFVDRLPRCCKTHPNLRNVMIDVYDEVSEMLSDVMDLPTWNEVHMRVSGTAIRMEVGDDYRITQWTEEHAHEYSTKQSGKGW